jgi:hypothetical protein
MFQAKVNTWVVLLTLHFNCSPVRSSSMAPRQVSVLHSKISNILLFSYNILEMILRYTPLLLYMYYVDVGSEIICLIPFLLNIYNVRSTQKLLL